MSCRLRFPELKGPPGQPTVIYSQKGHTIHPAEQVCHIGQKFKNRKLCFKFEFIEKFIPVQFSLIYNLNVSFMSTIFWFTSN